MHPLDYFKQGRNIHIPFGRKELHAYVCQRLGALPQEFCFASRFEAFQSFDITDWLLKTV